MNTRTGRGGIYSYLRTSIRLVAVVKGQLSAIVLCVVGYTVRGMTTSALRDYVTIQTETAT